MLGKPKSDYQFHPPKSARLPREDEEQKSAQKQAAFEISSGQRLARPTSSRVGKADASPAARTPRTPKAPSIMPKKAFTKNNNMKMIKNAL